MSPDASDTPTRSMATRIRRGALWSGINTILMRMANVAIMAVVARLLSQADFGVFALALAVHMVVASLAELGLASAIARSRFEPEEIAPTITTLSIGVSAVLSILMMVFAEPIAAALGSDAVAEPVRVLSLSLFLTGLFAVPGAQLSRGFRQDRILLASALGFVPANALLVWLALNGGGATAFAWSRVVGQLIAGVVMVMSVNRIYRPGMQRSLVKPLLAFGLPLAAANLINWALLNADYVVVGRFLTESDVGIYMIAFSVAGWSTAVLGSVLNGVVVPAFGRVSHDPGRLHDALISATRLVAMVALPIGVVTAMLAHPLIETVFGSSWLPAAPVLVVLAAYGVLYAFSLLFANVIVATGSTRSLLLIQVVWISCLVPAIAVGVVRNGLAGAAWAHVVVMVGITLPAYLFAMRGDIPCRVSELFVAARRPAMAAVAAGAVAALSARVVEAAWGQLVLGGLAAVLAYALLVFPVALPYLPGSWQSRLRRSPVAAAPLPTKEA